MDLFDFNPVLLKYIEDHTSPEDKVLSDLRRYTYLKVVHPRMLSGPVQGRFLEIISKLIQPLRILEVGTYTGYSAICLARGLKKEGKLFTIELNDELEQVHSKFFAQAGLKDKIVKINGDARLEIPKLDEDFDLIFIDGEKEQYIEYYEAVLPKTKKGGLIIVDNVLWDGKVIDEQFRKDSSTLSIKNFNRLVNWDIRVENVVLPLRDGLMLIRKL
ncbi:MAG: O-methyltransferase [Bacteroidales bacterium]